MASKFDLSTAKVLVDLVYFRVLRERNNPQILKAIVFLVPIYMMDKFISLEFSPNKLFHNYSMDKNLFSVLRTLVISLLSFPLSISKFILLICRKSFFKNSVTSSRTELIFTTLKSIYLTVDYFIANTAWNILPAFWLDSGVMSIDKYILPARIFSNGYFDSASACTLHETHCSTMNQIVKENIYE